MSDTSQYCESVKTYITDLASLFAGCKEGFNLSLRDRRSWKTIWVIKKDDTIKVSSTPKKGELNEKSFDATHEGVQDALKFVTEELAKW